MPCRARRCAYSSDLTDAQWAAVAPMIPDAAPGGRPRKADKREIVAALLYPLRAGRAWRLSPRDFPPWQRVYDYMRRWKARGLGWRASTSLSWPTASTPAGSPRLWRRSLTAQWSGQPIKRASKGYEAGKRIHGRKRHILTDTDGRLREGRSETVRPALSLRRARLRGRRLCGKAGRLGEGQGQFFSRSFAACLGLRVSLLSDGAGSWGEPSPGS
jgi:transposase